MAAMSSEPSLPVSTATDDHSNFAATMLTPHAAHAGLRLSFSSFTTAACPAL